MNLPEIDTLLFFFINRDLQNSIFDATMPFITRKAYLIFLPFYLLLYLKDRKTAIAVLILGFSSILAADWASNELKHFFERVRPCNALDGVRLLVGCGKSFSMPSNHAVNAFAFATPFFIFLKSRIRYAFLAVALSVCFSRIYVGVHYPSDVIAGATVGMAMAVLVVKLYQWAHERHKTRPHTTVLFLFLLALSLFRVYYIQNGPLDLSPDEAHYWEWSRRLDLSYYSKGPMIAYLIYIGTQIFGDTVFGIRIMAVIFSGLSSILIYILGKRLYDARVGLLSAVLLQVIPLFSAYGVVFTIDSPFIFFWTLSLFLFWKAVNNPKSEISGPDSNLLLDSGNPPYPPLEKGGKSGFDPARKGRDFSMVYWRVLGLSIGLGLLTKYTMAFFYPCAFLFMVFSKDKRRLLLSTGPYIALIISILIFSPVIIWNADHGWVTFKHTAGQAHLAAGIQISLKDFVEFLGSQFGVITPLLFILMGISLWKLRREREGSFLFWFSAPVIAFFLLKSIQGKVQANWALTAYITGIIAFSAFSLRIFLVDGKVKKILVVTAAVLSLAVTCVSHYPGILNIPPNLDPTSRLTGWEELGTKVDMIYEQMSEEHPVFIFSDRYQVSSELAFYVTGRPVTYCINLGRRMNQYDLWPGFSALIHYNAIFVRTGDAPLPEEVGNAFRNVEKKVITAYTKNHEKIRDYSVFLCYDFKGLKVKSPETY